MEKKEINISYHVFSSIDELDQQFQVLMKKAEESLNNAYAIYSGFYVGAALLLDNGEI